MSRAYRLLGAGRAEMVDVPRPEPGPDEVLHRVLAAGVCRTDLALLRGGGADGVTLPVTLGHEVVGEVVALGEGLSAPQRGAVMAVYELLGCGGCSASSRGEDNVCRDVVPGAIGITRDGGMADHVVVPARSLVAVGDVDPVHAAALTDAGMTALHAVERGRALLEPGAVAVVVGIGGLGHLAVQVLRATSAVRVLAVDVDRARLDLPRRSAPTTASRPERARRRTSSRRTPVARSTPFTTSSARRRASTSPRRSPGAAAGSSSPEAAAAGCRSPHGRSRSPRPAGFARTSRPRPRGRRSGACRSGRRERARARRARALRKGESHVVSCARTD